MGSRMGSRMGRSSLLLLFVSITSCPKPRPLVGPATQLSQPASQRKSANPAMPRLAQLGATQCRAAQPASLPAPDNQSAT